MLKIFIFLILASCSKVSKEETQTPLEKLARQYTELLPSVQDEHGFIETEACDSLLFSGLIGAAGIRVNLTAAEISPGEWARRSSKDCYDEGLSRSRTSRDMLLGVMYYAWYNKDLNMLERLFQYGKDNNWVMGYYRPGDTKAYGTMLFNPNYISLLARLIHGLGGADSAARYTPIVLTRSCQGFECHLSTLFILLLGEVSGLKSSDVDILEKNSIQNPNNILHAAAANLYGRSRPILVNEWYPYSRLPSNIERCEPWAIQRSDLDTGLTPCNQTKTHSGGEVIFVNWLLTTR